MWKAHFYAERKMKCVWCRTQFTSCAEMRMLFCGKRMNTIFWVTLQDSFFFIFKRRYCGIILRLSTHFEMCSGCFTVPSSFPSPHKYNKEGLN